MQKTVIALKKARTSIDSTIKMVEDKEYCIDIIQQNLAAIGLLKSANLKLLEDHLHHCFKNAAKANDEKRLDTMIEELSKVMKTAQNK